MLLHNITKSPFNQSTDNPLYARLSANDSVILTQDAVYWLCQTEQLHHLVSSVAVVYVLREDTTARGLGLTCELVTYVDYAQWVELSVQHSNVITW